MAIELDIKKEKKDKLLKFISFLSFFSALALLVIIGALTYNVFYFIFSFILIIFWLFLMFIPTLLTIGLIWLSEKWRAFVDAFTDLALGFTKNAIIIDYSIFMKVSYVCLAFLVINLVISILAYVNKKISSYKSLMILNITFTSISVVCFVIGYFVFK